MLKNRFLNTTTAVFLAPDDEGKSAAAKAERDKIEVTNNTKENDDGENTEEKDNKEADKTDENNEEGNENSEEGEEADKEKVEAKEAEEDDDEEKKAKKEARAKERMQARIDKKTKELNDAQKRIKELEEKQSGNAETLTKAEAEELSEAKANQKVAEREFTRACNRLADAAEKIDKQFTSRVKDMSEEIGPIPVTLIGILDELDNGGAVLNYLTKNVDDAEEIYTLTPAKMALRLARLSADLSKKPVKEISRLNPPITPLGGKGNDSGGRPNLRDPKVPTKDWIAERNRQIAERKKAQRDAMH